MNPRQIWQAALGELQLEMTQAAFNTWLRDTKLVAYEDGDLIVGVRNGYAKDWLENRLKGTVQRVVTRLANRTVRVRFVAWEEPAETPEPTQPAPLLTEPEPVHNRQKPSTALNPRYTLENFVVGSSNRLAHAAALAVAEHPADTYNPFFIYGGTGLGKTHLLQAIGHACRARNLSVLYVPAETFTNDLVESIRTYTTEAFRETYRTANVLLVDDVQFIAGKEATQEEFFHTFNALHSCGAQIVLSSDRRPRAMATLEDRLRSRFEWGLIVDIRPPDLETRMAILQQKAEGRRQRIPDDVLYLIAQRVPTNIRELEGVLNKVLMLASVEDAPLTPELVEVAVADLASTRPEVSPEQVINAIAHHYQLTLEELESSSRSRRIARPRQVAMYLIREETELSLAKIGELFGGRDHSTVLYAHERVTDLADEDETFRRELLALREQLRQRTKIPA